MELTPETLRAVSLLLERPTKDGVRLARETIALHVEEWDKEIWAHEDLLVKLCASLGLEYCLAGEPDILARVDALESALRRLRAAETDCVALRNWDHGFEDWADVAELRAAQLQADATLAAGKEQGNGGPKGRTEA